MYRLLVCGDRKWTNKALIKACIAAIGIHNIEVLIEGEARGADQMARDSALELGLPKDKILRFPANWREYGKKAGRIRNWQQLHEGKPNLVLAFHNDFKHSKGTLHMVGVAFHECVRTILITENSVEEVESRTNKIRQQI